MHARDVRNLLKALVPCYFIRQMIFLSVIQDGVCFISTDLRVIYSSIALKCGTGIHREDIGGNCYQVYHFRTESCEDCPVLKAAAKLCISKKAEEMGLLFAVNYSYSGNHMVKEARELILSGHIGDIVNVNAEYLHEWLIDDIGAGDETMNKLSVWRKDPEKAGSSNCVGDIGSHIKHTVSYMTGLHVTLKGRPTQVYKKGMACTLPLPLFIKRGTLAC